MLHQFKAWPSTAATCTETNKCQRPASQYAGQSQDTVEAKLEVATPPVRRSAVPIRLQELAWSSTYAPHRLVTSRMGLYACMCAHATYSATYVCMCAVCRQVVTAAMTIMHAHTHGHWDLHPGPSACEADVIPLHHVPNWCQYGRVVIQQKLHKTRCGDGGGFSCPR